MDNQVRRAPKVRADLLDARLRRDVGKAFIFCLLVLLSLWFWYAV
ncbi:hypothetical protein QM565_36155 [Geitlerinema splendidum]|nr:hypothetical protein [Geitlerinema splendidum]